VNQKHQSVSKGFSNIIQVSWKTSKLLFHKFIQHKVYQIFIKIDRVLLKIWQNILVCFFQFTV